MYLGPERHAVDGARSGVAMSAGEGCDAMPCWRLFELELQRAWVNACREDASPRPIRLSGCGAQRGGRRGQVMRPGSGWSVHRAPELRACRWR